MGGMGSWKIVLTVHHKSFNSQNTSKHKLLVFIAENGKIRFIILMQILSSCKQKYPAFNSHQYETLIPFKSVRPENALNWQNDDLSMFPGYIFYK